MGQGEALVRARMSELTALCRRFGARRLELFGSALRGLGYADAYFGLQEGLEQLFGRSVDLLSFAAVKNPHLLQAIERSKRSLYAA